MIENNLPRSEMTLDEAIKHAEEKSDYNGACAMEHRQLAQWLKELKILRENILPRPVIRDGNGKRIKGYTPRYFYLKFQEEIFEVIEYLEIYNQMTEEYGKGYDGTKSAIKHTAEEIANIMTLCISYLNAIGYDEEKRSDLFAKVNEKNEKRGYFKE